ncbi:hypothetical protein NKI86_06975 [Mesorhizobium sp. M0320]
MEDWKAGAATLRSRLDADQDLSPIVTATFLQGSVRRSTAIRPIGDKRPDVDIVVVTNIDYENTTPQQAMDQFVPFLERFYPDKWRPQGRSFGIELSYVDLDLVITALPKDPESRKVMESLYRSKSVLTVESVEEDPTWRLNEEWQPSRFGETASVVNDAAPSAWRPHPLFLPDRDLGQWGRTHPLAQIQWTAAKNRACSGHYVNLVRAVKWMKQEGAEEFPKYPKGYPLEHMVGNVLEDGTASMATGLVDVLESIRDTWAEAVQRDEVPNLPDHGVPEHDVLKRLSIEDFKAFHKAASEVAVRAREALQCDDAAESADLWRSLLGSRFPLPGPRGGDRPTSIFNSPTKPAQPQTTGRFA